MKRLALAAIALCLPVAIAFAQPAAAPGAAPKSISLYGNGGATGPTTLETPKLNLMPTLEYMRQVINPHANAYWAAEGYLDDEDTSKVEGAPADDDAWAEQLSRAATLMEAGNGLFTAGRPRNGRCVEPGAAAAAPAAPARGAAAPAAPARGGAAPARGPGATCDMIWNHYAQELIDGGSAALVAARTKNAKAGFEAGSTIYDACFGCHARFIPRPANSRYTAPFPSDEEIRQKGGAKGQ